VVAGSSVGTLVGGRGCVEEILADRQYMVTVVWQGATPIAAPPASVTCGANLYNLPAGSDCADPAYADFCRRFVTTMVRIADLTDLSP
jgi:type IV pilus assembly protein PilV